MPSAAVLVPWMYLLLPVAAFALALLRYRVTGNGNAVRELFVTFVAGAASGLALVFVYMHGFHGDVSIGQIAITSYWGIAVATLLRGFSSTLSWGFRRIVPRGAVAWVISSLLRAAILLAVTIPYLGAMVLIYRPHVVHPGTPMSVLGVDYQPVTFEATDGTRLSGWWIPAARTQRTDDRNPPAAPGERTVILCHGFGADKAAQLLLLRDLVPNGYNVLAFDFRGHGESAGQFTTFGDLERRDVLGAVRWIRRNHPDESRRIFGLGETLGAAALIGAAADPSSEGQAIDAVAVFAPFDRLSMLMQDVADEHYVPSAGWLARNVALPMAGLQLGTPLGRFSPEDEVDKLAPRPLLVIASENDRRIDFYRSQRFYEEASQPKYAYWIHKGSRRKMLFSNDKASTAVRVFFETARQIL